MYASKLLVQSVRFSILILFLAFCAESTYGNDSLKVALQLHQASHYQKALPYFIRLSAKFKKEQDIQNYALCQVKIADIIRMYGGPHVAIELLTENEKRIAASLYNVSLLMAQNHITKGEAFFAASRLTDYKKSIEQSISIKRQLKLPEKYLLEEYFYLGRYYKEFQNQNDSCLYWTTKALALAKSYPSHSLYVLPKIYNLMGQYYHPASGTLFVDKKGLFKLDSMERNFYISRRYYDSAFIAINNQPEKDESIVSLLYHNLGNSYNNQIYVNRELFLQKAIAYYRRSLSIIEKYGAPSEMALKHWVMGVAYYRGQKNDSAISEFHNGLVRVMPEISSYDIREIPPLQPTLSDEWFCRLTFKKAEQFYDKYKASKKEEDLMAAYEHFTFLLKFNNYLISRSIDERESAYQNQLYTLNNYQTLVEIGFELYKKTGNVNDLLNAYTLISKSKYAYLNKDDIEQSVSNSINQAVLKVEMDLLKRNILKSIPSLTKADLLSVFLRTNTTTTVPLSQINVTKQVDSSVEKIQKVLSSENSVLIDFYLRDLRLYTIIISKNSFTVHEQNLSVDFKSTVWKIRKSYGLNNPTEYARLSNKLYKEMLDSVIMIVPKETTDLIICPDYFIQNIPWDALVVDTLHTNSFKELDYLVNRFNIRTVLTPRHLLTEDHEEREGFYGVAPGFENSKRFSAIPFSTSLVKTKAEQYNGKFTEVLQKDSLKLNVLHIASHVVNDSLRPYNSTLYFNDTDSLTISQLATTTISPQLAILNGCQTGSGTYYQTEGTISFARALYRMGAKSVIMTLWSVDDKSTADILEDFYQEVEDGASLNEALRAAKINFIQNAPTDELANPYYWAGLQLSGNAKPIHSKNYTWIIYAAMSFITSLLFLLWIKKKKWPLSLKPM